MSPDRALVNKYCVVCHNQRLHTAGILLDTADIDHPALSAQIWEKALAQIRTGQMPPAGMPRPDKPTFNAFTASLENSLDRAAAVKPNPGRIPIHRLSRTEYVNAVRDLLGLTVDGRSLLVADDVDKNGFDNIAGVLSVSPALMEQYMSAARKISRLAVGDVDVVPVFETYSVPSSLFQDQRMSEELPFGSRGGLAVHHYFPVDGEYAIRVRLKRQLYGYILGMGRKHQLEIRVNNQRIKLFTVGGEAPSTPSPSSFAGNVMGDPKWDLYMHEADKGLEFRFSAKAGTATVGVSFDRDSSVSEEIPQPRETSFGLAINELYEGNPAVESVSIGGPYRVDGAGDTPSRRKIFSCHPSSSQEELSCPKKIVSSLARAAYRRPVTDSEISTLLQFYDRGRQHGGFEAGIELAINRILADPRFLFRMERDPPNVSAGAIYRLTDLEIASRLSFFLWSSIPDEELLDLASAGQLRDPHILAQQVRRMLQDIRANSLVTNFAFSWLELAKDRTVLPDPDQYYEFDDNLRQAILKETELFLQSQLHDDDSLVDLLNANYTYVNDRLAEHYGIPNIYGSHFRRITVDDPARRGLLGQASILMATSYPNRTSPVIRGKWLLDNLLGMPPPPPPPNVPALKDSGANGRPASVRERMEEHRKNPACAVCHVRMDPLGFALENFDAVGKWRSSSDGLPIDASASLPDGTKFDGVPSLRQVLVSRKEDFLNTFTAKLLTYALGREIEYYDLPAVRKIVNAAAADNYRWSSVILGIVSSTPFQMSVVKSEARTNQTAQLRSSDKK